MGNEFKEFSYATAAKAEVPKSRQGKRRSHLRAPTPHVISCPRCKSPRLAHHACPICGTYRGREAISMPAPELED